MHSALRERLKIRGGGRVGRARAACARYRPAWTAATLLAALTLAALAQVQFDQNRTAWRWEEWQGPAAVGAVSLVLFGLATHHVRTEAPWRDPPAVAWGRLLPPLLAGAIIAAASIPWFTDNTFRLPGLALLAGGMALALLALARERPAPSPARHRPQARTGLAWEWAGLVLIIALGAALRLYRLDEIPGELTLDQISKFWDVRDVLLGKRAPIFFEANQGRESLFFYLLALASQILGLGFMTMKLTSALAGIATIPAFYLLGREIGGREVGTVAALLLAVNKWHILVSRLGYRVILAPLFVILVLLFLARALRRGRLLDYGWTGVMLGLGMYSYKSFPCALPAALSCTLFYALRRRGRAVAGTAIMLLMALLVFIPNGVYAATAWEEYLYRENLQRRLLAEHYDNSELTPMEGYLVNVRKVALMDNFIADPIEIYNPRHERFFGPVSAALLILGLGYVLSRAGRGRNALLLLFPLWLIQPVALSMFPPYEWANTLRAAATIGPGLLIAAFSLPVVRRHLNGLARTHLPSLELAISRDGAPAGQDRSRPASRIRLRPSRAVNAFLIVAIGLALGLETGENYRSVFQRYPAGQRFDGYPLARAIADEIARWGGEVPVFVKYTYSGIDVGLIKVHLASQGLEEYWNPDDPDSPWGYQIETLALDQPPLSRSDLPAGVYILYPDDIPQGLEPLRERYPAHIVLEHELPNGQLGYAVFIGHE